MKCLLYLYLQASLQHIKLIDQLWFYVIGSIIVRLSLVKLPIHDPNSELDTRNVSKTIKDTNNDFSKLVLAYTFVYSVTNT